MRFAGKSKCSIRERLRLGAKIVARAWIDPEFRARLLADGRGACEEMGITFYDNTGLIVVENTETGSQPDRLHTLLLLSASRAGASARLVQAQSRIVRGPSKSRARCWLSSARSFPMMWKFASVIQPPGCDTSCCQSGRRDRRFH